MMIKKKFSYHHHFLHYALFSLMTFFDIPSVNAQVKEPPASDSITRIALGSCNRENLPQPLWRPIISNHPQLWIWTGDAVYGDTEDMQVLKKKFEFQKNRPEYQTLLQTGIPILGVWDDHDYGVNDGGKDFASKKEAQQIYLDFLGEPKDGPRRQQEGIYTSSTYGPKGQQIKVLLLDIRYHKEKPGPKADLLGKEQWKWLEQELHNSTAQIHLIVSGIQIIPDQHRFEKWSNYPHSRQGLLQLLAKKQTPGVILVSGDRHFAEISKLAPSKKSLSYPLYELTSSGLTHSYTPLSYEYNPYRVGKIFKELNFGYIEIHWDQGPVTLSLQVRDKENMIPVETTIDLSELTPVVPMGKKKEKPVNDIKKR